MTLHNKRHKIIRSYERAVRFIARRMLGNRGLQDVRSRMLRMCSEAAAANHFTRVKARDVIVGDAIYFLGVLEEHLRHEVDEVSTVGDGKVRIEVDGPYGFATHLSPDAIVTIEKRSTK